MRPAGKGALESLCFDYPKIAARRVPELDGATARHPVLIVDAGPIGMTAALVLGHELGDVTTFGKAIKTALEDLE